MVVCELEWKATLTPKISYLDMLLDLKNTVSAMDEIRRVPGLLYCSCEELNERKTYIWNIMKHGQYFYMLLSTLKRCFSSVKTHWRSKNSAHSKPLASSCYVTKWWRTLINECLNFRFLTGVLSRNRNIFIFFSVCVMFSRLVQGRRCRYNYILHRNAKLLVIVHLQRCVPEKSFFDRCFKENFGKLYVILKLTNCRIRQYRNQSSKFFE